MIRVYDFKDIRELNMPTFKDLFRKGTMITATKDLSLAMREYYKQNHYTVYDVYGLINALIPEWNDEVKDIKNYVILRNVINNYAVDNGLNTKTKTYLMRNAAEMWSAIKMLVEAGVYPDDVDEKESLPLKHFKQIWNEFECDNDLLMKFRGIFEQRLMNKEHVIQEFTKKVGKINKNVFLFGFYYITPIQHRIFDILEQSGYDLYFLNCHDEKYNYACEIWEKTFEEAYKKGVRNIHASYDMKNPFGEALLGNGAFDKVRLIKHESEMEFVQMVKSAFDNGESLYSPNSRECEKVLREYYPEYYNRKHILSYPVGQYVSNIHAMWDSFKEKIYIEYDNVYKCFVSGWLNTERYCGKDYAYEMKILEVYFKDIHTIEAWSDGINRLIRTKKETETLLNDNQKKDRWIQLMGNPYNNMGIYAIPEEKLIAIKELVEALIKDVEFLFKRNATTDLFEHFERVIELIQIHMSKDALLYNEREIVDELLKMLSDESTKNITCPLSSVREAIQLLVGNHYGDYDSFEKQTSRSDGMVKPLEMIESELLCNKGQRVNLVLASESWLPSPKKQLPWPLNRDVINSLIINDEDTKKYVSDMCSVAENRALADRYLFYTFTGVQNASDDVELEIEWICEKNNKAVDVTPYAKLLGCDKADTEKNLFDEDMVEKIFDEDGDKSVINEPVLPPGNGMPQEVRMDYWYCPFRYNYAYVLNDIPRFSSEFHYQFLLSKLIAYKSKKEKVGKTEAANSLFEMFPFLLKVEKKQSQDFSASSKSEAYSYKYDGIEYDEERLEVHYLYTKLKELCIDYENDNTGSHMSDCYKGDECIYCPYSEVCLERRMKPASKFD